MNYSVVIPCYNCENVVVNAIDSAMSQTVAPIEIICVNNNSSDNTQKVLEKLAGLNPLIKVLNESKQGASYARNTGLEESVGEYIQFLDSDDLIDTDKVEKQLEYVKQYNFKYADLVADSYVVIEGDKKYKVDVSEGDIWLALIKGKMGYTTSNLWRREILIKLGGFDVNLKTSEEYELIYRIMKESTRVLLLNTFSTTKIEDNQDSLTKKTPHDNWVRYTELRMAILLYLKSTSYTLLNSHYMAVFDVIRILYQYDKTYALELYNRELKGCFKIEKTNTTNSLYRIIFNVFGFSLAEKIREIIK